MIRGVDRATVAYGADEKHALSNSGRNVALAGWCGSGRLEDTPAWNGKTYQTQVGLLSWWKYSSSTPGIDLFPP